MNPELALVVFSLVIVVVVMCLTVVTLVAIVFGKDQLATKTLGVLEKVSIRLPGLKPAQTAKGLKTIENAPITGKVEKHLQ